MRYWIDTEFVERPYTINLISIGLVAEDGREFYAESSEVDWTKASQWTLQTVRPQLEGAGMKREEIGYAIRRFVDGDESPVFWGFFPAYDWVAFCWLFGSMDELPFHFPQLCLDIKQWAIELGDPDLPRQSGPRHHALHDARWTRVAWTFLASSQSRRERAALRWPKKRWPVRRKVDVTCGDFVCLVIWIAEQEGSADSANGAPVLGPQRMVRAYASSISMG